MTKNVQVIDGADNCTYSIFALTDEEFALLFPAPGQDIEFIEDAEIQGPVPTGSEEAASNGGRRRCPPSVAQGRHDTSRQREERAAKERHGSQDAAGAGAKRQPVTEGESPPSAAE